MSQHSRNPHLGQLRPVNHTGTRSPCAATTKHRIARLPEAPQTFRSDWGDECQQWITNFGWSPSRNSVREHKFVFPELHPRPSKMTSKLVPDGGMAFPANGSLFAAWSKDLFGHPKVRSAASRPTARKIGASSFEQLSRALMHFGSAPSKPLRPHHLEVDRVNLPGLWRSTTTTSTLFELRLVRCRFTGCVLAARIFVVDG